MQSYTACDAPIRGKLQKCIRMGITIFEIFIWGGISSDKWSKITHVTVKLNLWQYIRRYTSPNEYFEYSYPLNKQQQNHCLRSQVAINCKGDLWSVVGDWTHAVLFVGCCHLLRCQCIGQLYTIRWLLSDILDVVWKHQFLKDFLRHKQNNLQNYTHAACKL